MKGKIDKALEVLEDEQNLRKVYDYNLKKLISKVEGELAKREEKRKAMVNSLEDMCDRMLEWEEDEFTTFYYEPKNPEQLMESSEEDEITDYGFEHIRQQIGARGKKVFKHAGHVFEVSAHIEEGKGYKKGYFDLEIRDELEEI